MLGTGPRGAYVVTWSGTLHCARATFEEADEFVHRYITDITSRGVAWEHPYANEWVIREWSLKITYCPFYPAR